MTKKKETLKPMNEQELEAARRMNNSLMANLGFNGIHDHAEQEKRKMGFLDSVVKTSPVLDNLYVYQLAEKFALEKLAVDISERLRELNRGPQNETYRCIC